MKWMVNDIPSERWELLTWHDVISHKTWTLNYWFLHHDNTPAHQVLSVKKFTGGGREGDREIKKVLYDLNTPFPVTPRLFKIVNLVW
jgi:hypothetical protein